MKYLITYLSLTKKSPVKTYVEAESSGQAVLDAIDEIEDCGPIVGATPVKSETKSYVL